MGHNRLQHRPFGLAASVQVCAMLPDKFIAFEIALAIRHGGVTSLKVLTPRSFGRQCENEAAMSFRGR
jgi:hypothetical protein